MHEQVSRLHEHLTGTHEQLSLVYTPLSVVDVDWPVLRERIIGLLVQIIAGNLALEVVPAALVTMREPITGLHAHISGLSGQINSQHEQITFAGTQNVGLHMLSMGVRTRIACLHALSIHLRTGIVGMHERSISGYGG